MPCFSWSNRTTCRLLSALFSSAALLTGASHPSLPPSLHPSVSPSILQRGTTFTNLPPGAGLFPRSPSSFVHKKNTGSSSLCFSFSFSFCCSGVSGRSALLAFFTVSGPLNKTSFYFIHRKTHTHTHTHTHWRGRHGCFYINTLCFIIIYHRWFLM